jgi:nucleotide-binding universal stress UspA family protein
MNLLFYNEGQKYSEKALKFFAEIFRYTNAEITVLSTQQAGSRAKEDSGIAAKKTLKKLGLKNTDVKVFSGPADKVLKQELKKGNALLVKALPDLNAVISEIAEQNADELALKLIGDLTYSILLIKNPPQKLRKVLICTDGSQEAEAAIKFFGSLQLKPQPQIKILNVIPRTFSFFKSYLEPATRDELDALVKIKNQRTKYLYSAKKILSDLKLKTKIKLRTGDATEEILKEAAGDFDLIIMGLRGRKVDRKKEVGRHTRDILARAKTSVLAVRG